MKPATSKHISANQQATKSVSSDTKPTKRGTCSFSSKVPRFPIEKIAVTPSPGQYDPVVKENIKGGVPLSKQLPRTHITSVSGNNLSTLRNNPKLNSNHSSTSSFHSTRERSSSGSTNYSTSAATSRVSLTRASLRVPFAPPRRCGIVKAVTASEVNPRTTRPPPPINQPPLRSNTFNTISRNVPVKTAQRLTSGNPMPGETAFRKFSTRPVTAGNPTRTGPTIVRAGTRVCSATPLTKPPAPAPVTSPVTRRSGSSRPQANSPPARKSPSCPRSSAPRPRAPSPEDGGARSPTPPASVLPPPTPPRARSPIRKRTASPTPAESQTPPRRTVRERAVSPTSRARKKSSKREEIEIEREIQELMARKMAQSAKKQQQQHRDVSRKYSGRSSRSSSPGASRSSSSTGTSYAGWSQQVVAAVGSEANAVRRLSGSSAQSDRTTTSWMDRDMERSSTSAAARRADSGHDMPTEFSSLTYMDEAETLCTPLVNCVRKYFTHEAGNVEMTSTRDHGGVMTLPFDVKAFKDLGPQTSYVSSMFQVFEAGVVASNKPSPHMGDSSLGAGGYHPLRSKFQPSEGIPVSSSPAAKTRPTKTLPHSRRTAGKLPVTGATSKPAAAKPRTVVTKATRGDKFPRKVNETESFPRAVTKRKYPAGGAHSFTTTQANNPQVILQKGNKYYSTSRHLLPRTLIEDTARLKPVRPGSVAVVHAKRSRTLEGVNHERRCRVTFKPRSSSLPSKKEAAATLELMTKTDAAKEGGTAMSVEDAEVEISSTSYEEDTPVGRKSTSRLEVTKEEVEPDGVLSTKSEEIHAGIAIDMLCSNNSITIFAHDERPEINEDLTLSKSLEFYDRDNQKEYQPLVSKVLSELSRPVDKKSRAKSTARPVAYTNKCRKSPRSMSHSETEKLRAHPKSYEPDVRSSELSFLSSSDPQNARMSRSAASDSSRRSSSGGRIKDERQSAGLEYKKFDIQLPKLPDDMQTHGTKPAGQYVRDSISLLDVIPLTAQKISETFHKMLEGMRSYLTDAPFVHLKRNELQEQMLAYINEADGNAFYIRQEVKTELHRCVTQINGNLQELLYLNNCVQEERQAGQNKIEALCVREDMLADGMEEYKRLNECLQENCDDLAYKCLKEQETRRFIEGSKEMVEKDIVKQRKELRDAEDEVARLRRDIKEFERKLEEVKKLSLQKDAKAHTKLRSEERTSLINADMLVKVKDEKGAIQRTLHQMNESHIRLNNQNMAKIQELEKHLRDIEEVLSVEKYAKSNVERELRKKDDYLKLVEGATVNLVRQTNPGREQPSMPEDFGLNEREVAVWEQLNLCRGRLEELETENQSLLEERMLLIQKTNDMERIYQWVHDNECLLKATQNEFTILEQPNAELVEEMEQMRTDNRDLKDKLVGREKHCSLAHEKIEKLQDLLNSLRISETEDADCVLVATLQHQICDMKASMREMLERTKELDLRCASQEIQLKQRDYHARNQQRLLETRNQVIDVLKQKGRDVSTLESLMGFGDSWRKNNEERQATSATATAAAGTSEPGHQPRRTPSQLAKNELRIGELEQLVLKMETHETDNYDRRIRLENTIAELELKLLKAERAKYYRGSRPVLPTLT